MPLQDLTPQLRTRLNRMERAVGWFILLAAALLIFGFGYYIYNTAERRGWFKIKAPYYTYAQNGNGFAVGDPVKLMGFAVGNITKIEPMPPRGPGSEHNVYVEFEVLEPNYGYLWTEGSMARWKDQGLLGKRELDLSKGTNGYGTYLSFAFQDNLTLEQVEKLPHVDKWRLAEEIYLGTNREVKAWLPFTTNLFEKLTGLGITNELRALDTSDKKKQLTIVWDEQKHYYEWFTNSQPNRNLYGLPPDEPPALTDRLQTMVGQIEAALPNFLQLTNQLSGVLSNATRLTENLNTVAENARPMLTNLNVITAQLRNPKGSLGEWLIPTNINQQLGVTLETADGTLANANTNLLSLNRALDNLGNITSNLNNQVQANSNILANISDLVVHSDQFVQGLKRFWLFRHLFRTSKTNAPPRHADPPLLTPRQKSERE